VLRWVIERGNVLRKHPGSRQIAISAADHFYTGREQFLAEQIGAFIEQSR